jgi:hypothetical protein
VNHDEVKYAKEGNVQMLQCASKYLLKQKASDDLGSKYAWNNTLVERLIVNHDEVKYAKEGNMQMLQCTKGSAATVLVFQVSWSLVVLYDDCDPCPCG